MKLSTHQNWAEEIYWCTRVVLGRSGRETSRSGAVGLDACEQYVSSDKVRGRHWRLVTTPLFDEEGHPIYLLHHVEDVTDEVLLKRGSGNGWSGNP